MATCAENRYHSRNARCSCGVTLPRGCVTSGVFRHGGRCSGFHFFTHSTFLSGSSLLLIYPTVSDTNGKEMILSKGEGSLILETKTDILGQTFFWRAWLKCTIIMLPKVITAMDFTHWLPTGHRTFNTYMSFSVLYPAYFKVKGTGLTSCLDSVIILCIAQSRTYRSHHRKAREQLCLRWHMANLYMEAVFMKGISWQVNSLCLKDRQSGSSSSATLP